MSKDVFTFTEAGMRKVAEVVHNYEKRIHSLERLLAHFSTRRHQTVYMPSASDIHFELTDAITLRQAPGYEIEHTEAKLLEWDTDSEEWIDSEERIEVFDWFGDEGMWNGKIGYRGWAQKMPEQYTDGDGVTKDAYEIKWMERIAQKIKFDSTEYMSKTNPNQMSANVTWYDHQGKNPGGTVAIYDPQDLFPDAFENAKGVAYYNNHEERYEVVECQRLVAHASGTLSTDSCSGGSLTLTGFTAQPFGEFVGSPEGAPDVTNPYNHVGASGSGVQLIRVSNSMPNGNWVVIDMEKAPLTVVAKDGVTWSGTALEQQRMEIYAEFCDGTPTPETIVGSDECA